MVIIINSEEELPSPMNRILTVREEYDMTLNVSKTSFSGKVQILMFK